MTNSKVRKFGFSILYNIFNSFLFPYYFNTNRTNKQFICHQFHEISVVTKAKAVNFHVLIV